MPARSAWTGAASPACRPSSARCCGIARTFQVVRSFDSMTVLENVMVGAFARLSRTRARDGARDGDAGHSPASQRAPTRRRIR